MNVVVIGAGALGQLYGGLLALHGQDVHFLLRSEYEFLRKQKYFELYIQATDHHHRVEAPNLYKDSSLLPKADLVLITLKTTENQNLSVLLKDCLKKETKILIIQNGIGNEEALRDLNVTQTIVSGISTAAASKPRLGFVEIYHLGELRLAPFEKYDEIIHVLKDLLETGEFSTPVTLFENYIEMRFLKLLWNVPFCSLSIIHNLPANTLASTEPYVVMVKTLMQEVCDIACSMGVVIPERYQSALLDYTSKLKDYYPSTYWDFVNIKPIEKQYLFDNVLKIAHKNKVPTPLLSQTLKDLEKCLSHEAVR